MRANDKTGASMKIGEQVTGQLELVPRDMINVFLLFPPVTGFPVPCGI